MVRRGQVEETVLANMRISWPRTAAVRAHRAGVLTSLDVESGQAVEEGQVVATVDLAPVVVALGPVPAFRELHVSDPVIIGADVAQLQGFLQRTGFFSAAASGRFDTSTADAVRRWQRRHGWDATGTVPLGMIEFTPSLPSRVAYGEGVEIGRQVTHDLTLFHVLAPSPVTELVLGDSPGRIQAGQKVEPVEGPPGLVAGVITDVVEGGTIGHPATRTDQVPPPDQGTAGAPTLIATVRTPEGESVCSAACGAGDGSTRLVAVRVVVQPSRRGALVPVTALWFSADGRPTVQLVDGRKRRVEVLGEAHGTAVVSGVRIGERIRLAAPRLEDKGP